MVYIKRVETEREGDREKVVDIERGSERLKETDTHTHRERERERERKVEIE